MPLCYEILTIGTWDSFFPSSCFSGQNEMFSTTKQNQTSYSFFFFRYFSTIRLQSTSVIFILHYRGFHCLRYSRCRLHRYFLRCPFRSRCYFHCFHCLHRFHRYHRCHYYRRHSHCCYFRYYCRYCYHPDYNNPEKCQALLYQRLCYLRLIRWCFLLCFRCRLR